MQIHCYHHFDKHLFEKCNLDLDQLRTLQAVTDGNSFSAEARRLNLSQPAMSVHIRELAARREAGRAPRQASSCHQAWSRACGVANANFISVIFHDGRAGKDASLLEFMAEKTVDGSRLGEDGRIQMLGHSAD